MRLPKPPRGAPTWGQWLGFHRLVWGVIIRRAWSWVACLAIYGAMTWLNWGSDSTPVRMFIWLWTVVAALFMGNEIKWAYVQVIRAVTSRMQWQQMQQALREAMIQDGVSPEDADTALWQMDIEMTKRVEED